MRETQTNPVIRALPSLADFAFVMPLVWLFARMEGCATLLSDGDTGWHLRTGEWILAHGRVPDRDLFSFTRVGEPWFAWEWLWDVGAACLVRYGGLAALVLANAVLLGTIFALLYRLTRRVSGNAPVAIAVTFLAAAGSSVHWLARPHLVTLLFVVLFGSLLERGPAWPRVALLAGLTALWTNLHGGFFVGIVLVAGYAAGEAAAALTASQPAERAAAWRRAGLWLAGVAGCAAATFANPYGWRLHAHIYRYLADPYLFSHNREFVSLNFRHPAAIYFEAVLLAGAAAAFWSLCRRRFAHALLVATWAHLALFSARNVPIFLLVAAPVTALAVREWIERLPYVHAAAWLRDGAARFLRTASEIGEMDRIWRVHALSVAAVAAIAAVLYAPAPPELFRARFHPKLFPVDAVAVLEASGAGSRIFTDDQWGDYLIYSLYPKTRVFVDGRTDFYGSAFGERWVGVWGARHDWEANLASFGIDTVLLRPNAPLTGAMKESNRWRVVYDDGTAIVFRPANGAAPAAQQVSAAQRDGGSGRDREITKSQPCDRGITTTSNENQS